MNKLFPIESDHPLFRYFTDDERQRVEDIGMLRKVDAGDYLIRAGDTDASLFAVEAGHLLREGQAESFLLESKSTRSDLVTEYDRRSEELIVARLRDAFPEHGIVGGKLASEMSSQNSSTV